MLVFGRGAAILRVLSHGGYPTSSSLSRRTRIDDPARRHKKVKILSRGHKSRHGKGGSRSHSKGKEPTAPVEEPETLVESDEEDASLVHHRPRSMKDLFKTKVQKDDAGYYALYMSDLAHQDPDKEMQARWGKLKNSTKVWNDPSTAEEFEREHRSTFWKKSLGLLSLGRCRPPEPAP
ncbi:hypothetical protein BHE74_00049506 [Ensete ventricosum]|nr:hypothetical protein BHE74_00049506 [Ensete ventricosum]